MLSATLWMMAGLSWRSYLLFSATGVAQSARSSVDPVHRGNQTSNAGEPMAGCLLMWGQKWLFNSHWTDTVTFFCLQKMVWKP
jgi:hypothetical protein